MTAESIDWDDDTEDYPEEPRWVQYGFAVVGVAIAVAVAAWGLRTLGPVNVAGVVIGEAFGWSLCLLYVRELTKPRER